MKIGIDIRLIGKKRTGDEQVFFNLVKNLAEIDKENEYFLYTDRDPEKNPELVEEIRKLELKNNFKIIHIHSPNRFWWNLWALPNYFRKNPINIFHTQYIAPFWLPKKVRLVLTIHDISFNFFPQFIKYSDLFFLKTLIPRSLRMAEKIIAVSDFTKSEIEKYYKIPSKKIAVVHNGIDFELFNQQITHEKLESVRKRYHLPEKFILYLGTLQPRKNIPVLIEAMKILLYKYDLKNCKLVIAGNRASHNIDPKIDETIEKYYLKENILFPGWIEEKDKVALYKLACCFVYPTLYEGFGIPIIEAMATETPVICSDISALREVGNNSALFSDPLNPEKFAENIENLLKDKTLYKNLEERGRHTARSFSWQKNAQQVLEIYKTLS